ncbi:cation:proton antiporter [Nakamurella deserti]|uniref:cation:proton antiporter n=1 Tax=Nakamurella deserti TaxID=2164074 RepID=UPI000DBE30B1|nr:sodium:proton antiporter [Nakamurella deserti]
MESLLPVIGLIVGVLMVTTLAARYNAPAPIVLVVVGFAVSFIPGVPTFAASPDLVLYVLLPPLLFSAAFESSAVAIRQLIRPILQMSVVLVLLTAFTVAAVLKLVLPDLPFAAAVALGAIVAPPDAVAAVAVGRKVGLPRRLVTVLEGESLFNDATSLVTLKVAIAAIGATSLSWGSALGEFGWAALGGLAIGTALGYLLSFVRRIAGSPLTVTVLSLVSPFAAYAIGEEAHVSGVIVVVVVGLILGHRSPLEVAASVRLTEAANWAALRFALEGLVFALIGLQLWEIVNDLDTNQYHVFLAIFAVVATVLVSRPLWLSVIHLLTRLGPGSTTVGPRGVAALSWAGMRGVVSLAAAQTLPVDTPYRALLLVCTTTVIIGTLVLQGLSLPWVIRRLGVVEDHRADDLQQRTDAHARAAEEVNSRVDAMLAAGEVSDHQADLMRRWASMRDWRNWDDDAASREFGRRLSVVSDWRLRLLAIERSVIVQMRNDSELTEEVLAEMQRDLDLEEALLERRSEAVDGHLDEAPERAADNLEPEGDSTREDVDTKTRQDPDTGPSGSTMRDREDPADSGPRDVEDVGDLTEDAAGIDASEVPTGDARGSSPA